MGWGYVAQVVEHLPSKYEALSLTTSTANTYVHIYIYIYI
jgi:hypothetical protein